jgi:hypothetical protein
MPVHPDELVADSVSPLELAAALEAARLLEATAVAPAAGPGGEFVDRVMARLQNEPAPGPTGYLVPLRRSGLLGLAASVRQALWFVERGSRPLAVRTTALAYVLAVVLIGTSLTGFAAYGFAGALGLLGPGRTAAPAMPSDSPAPITEPPLTPDVTQAPPHATEPSGEAEPTESESDDREAGGGVSKPTATPRESEHEDGDEDEDEDAGQTPKTSEAPEGTPAPAPSASGEADD